MGLYCTNVSRSLIAFFTFCHCVTGTFVTEPENVTVYSGHMAEFTCKLQSGLSILVWRITEKYLQPVVLDDIFQAWSWDPEIINDPYTTSIALRMIGVSETNNTSVQCAAYYSAWQFSRTVYLSVQGILDTPSNLASSIMNDSVLVTWTPPSTLPGTTMSFTIIVSIGNHSENFTTSQHNFLIDLCDISNTSCYSNCELSVSVKSVNKAGEGEPTSITVPVQPFLCDGAEQDRPGLPMDLVACALDDSLSVSWSRPSSSHPISHYSVDVWDTQTESLIANEIEITDLLKYTLEYMAVGIDTCNRSYNVLISVCAVNVAGKGVAANTTLAIQQNMQSCPTTSVVESVTTPQASASTHSPHHFPQDWVTHLMPIISSVTAVVLLIVIVTGIVAVCICVKRRNKIDDDSKRSDVETGKNPSYEYSPSLTKNPCYEKPHQYESIDPVYSTVTEVKVQPRSIGVPSRLYPAHENA